MGHYGPDIIHTASPFVADRAVPTPNHAGLTRPLIDNEADFAVGPNAFTDLDVASFSRTGVRSREYFDDLYFRIHFSPGEINLGSILSVQTEEIRVWNAHLSSQEMTAYTEPSAEGVDVTEPVSAPYTLGALEELSYIVTVSTDGPPQFNDAIRWTISGLEYSVPVSGQRVVVWPFGPNWAKPLNESLEWKTDIITAFDGTEQRTQLRSKPRRNITYHVSLYGNELNQFNSLLYGWQNRQYALPIWYDKTVLSAPLTAGQTSIPVDTAGRGFSQGGLAVLITDTYTFEVFEIDQVNPTNLVALKPLEFGWPVLTRLYPLNLATLPSAVATKRETSRVMTANLDFRTDPVTTDPFIPSIPASELYGSYEVIYRKPNWGSPLEYTNETDYDLLDYETGAVQQIQKPTHSRQVRRFQWVLKNRADVTDFRALLGRLKGRYTPAFIPTWFMDFELTESAGSGSSGLKVKKSAYDAMVGVRDTQKHILVRMRNGDRFIREIIGVSVPDSENELLSLDSPIPFDVTTDDTLMISLVHLCRLRQDGVTINYKSDSVATVEITAETVKS